VLQIGACAPAAGFVDQDRELTVYGGHICWANVGPTKRSQADVDGRTVHGPASVAA
jgi:hypothetical protein